MSTLTAPQPKIRVDIDHLFNNSLIRLNRKGQIHTNLTSCNQCKDIGWQDYEYEVGITTHENNMDAQEFIIDNTVVHKAIIQCFQTSMTSCEGMVKNVARCLYNACEEHGTPVIDLYVKIRPVGVDERSYAWFEWSLSGNFK